MVGFKLEEIMTGYHHFVDQTGPVGDHPMHALWQYDHERLPMTAQIVKMNRSGGPEGVIDVVEELAPNGFASIDDVLTYQQREAIVRGYAKTAGFVQAQVNKPAQAA